MKTSRLESFSDGVLAIILTIMIFKIHAPHSNNVQSLLRMYPVFLSYMLSFINIGIYWNNHHHLLQATDKISGGIMWANLHLLFWLSLIPFVTGWVGENDFVPLAVAMYGGILFMAAIAYWILQHKIIRLNGQSSDLAKAIGRDVKGKISPIFYLVAIPMAYYNMWISGALYVAVAGMWLIPDRKIEENVINMEEHNDS
jgi:uncharacterized membrane protein